MTLPLARDRAASAQVFTRPSADVSRVMDMIDDRLGVILAAVPPRCRPLFAEALLRVAMNEKRR